MSVLRRLLDVLLLVCLLPWGAHLAAAAAPPPEDRAAAAAVVAAQDAPRVVTGLRAAGCRTALPVGPCHLDHLPGQTDEEAPRDPPPSLQPARRTLATGCDASPRHPPPKVL